MTAVDSKYQISYTQIQFDIGLYKREKQVQTWLRLKSGRIVLKTLVDVAKYYKCLEFAKGIEDAINSSAFQSLETETKIDIVPDVSARNNAILIVSGAIYDVMKLHQRETYTVFRFIDDVFKS